MPRPTKAVYNLFGDKAGLLRAMFLEGFDRLADGAPEADLTALGLAYRTSALDNPHLYQLMFGRPIAEFQPDQAALDQIQGTFDTLVRAVTRCVDAGRFAPADPHDIAVHLNALVHGLAGLELLGSLGPRPQADHHWRLALEAAFRGHRAAAP
ncbi:TetR-like C-terminal domain-containing protein [Nonomuraea sp. B1E8]|uniref:TetR-like C-terminal domain-containing protein n=1 Tax=unclassified Nonomuraea TaxID=2593643 RepID=UPI00325D661C